MRFCRPRSPRLAAFAVAFALAAWPSAAPAIVGPSQAETALLDRVVTVLIKGAEGSAFCTGVVVAPNVILTAAHCARAPADTAILVRGPEGAPALLSVSGVARHPDFHADAVQARRKSIDAALLRLAAPLPANFRAADLSSGPAPAPGDAITLAGFGVTRPGEPKTGGVLRRAALRAREPISALLLWAEGEGPGVGACSGDSGAPLLAADGSLVAIVAWVDGGDRRGCGGVTQGPLVRPLRPWIDGVIGRWNGREPPG